MHDREEPAGTRYVVLPCIISISAIDNLGRRYLRFLSSFGCFQRVFDLSAEEGTIQTLLEITQFTGLGLYLFLEDLTMVCIYNLVCPRQYTLIWFHH